MKATLSVVVLVIAIKIAIICAVIFFCVKGCNYVQQNGLKKIGTHLMEGSQN